MNEKVAAIKYQILEGMPEWQVQYKYQFTKDLHMFRVEGKGPTHWLYVSREQIEDCEPIILTNLVNVYHIVDTFSNAATSKRLFMGDATIREVDDSFAK